MEFRLRFARSPPWDGECARCYRCGAKAPKDGWFFEACVAKEARKGSGSKRACRITDSFAPPFARAKVMGCGIKQRPTRGRLKVRFKILKCSIRRDVDRALSKSRREVTFDHFGAGDLFE